MSPKIRIHKTWDEMLKSSTFSYTVQHSTESAGNLAHIESHFW